MGDSFTPSQISLEQRGERFPGLPLGVLRRKGLHAVECEVHLHGPRLLAPERPVVVEGGDSLGYRGAKDGEPSVVTCSTKLMTLCLVGPSFQERRRSAAKMPSTGNAWPLRPV